MVMVTVDNGMPATGAVCGRNPDVLTLQVLGRDPVPRPPAGALLRGRERRGELRALVAPRRQLRASRARARGGGRRGGRGGRGCLVQLRLQRGRARERGRHARLHAVPDLRRGAPGPFTLTRAVPRWYRSLPDSALPRDLRHGAPRLV